jgi:hypothetical protein
MFDVVLALQHRCAGTVLEYCFSIYLHNLGEAWQEMLCFFASLWRAQHHRAVFFLCQR